jgi:hypothetical protein
MTNKEHVFNLIKSSDFTDNVTKITKTFRNIIPPIRGELLESLIVDCLHPHIKNYKQGSREHQRDFSIIMPDKSLLRLSLKSGKIKGKKNPMLILNGSRMGSDKYY